MSKLSAKQKRFADEYLIDTNATQAAIRAGYSKRTAYSQGQRLLKHVEIKGYIDEQLEKIHNKNVADASEVMIYLTSVMRGESLSEIVVIEGTGEGCSDARRMNKAPDEREKLKAAEMIGKRYGMFTDKVNMEGAVPIVIVDDLEEDDDD